MSIPQNPIPSSAMVNRADNVMEKVYLRPSTCTKSQLKMSIGDPTVDGNLVTSAAATAGLVAHTHTPKGFGYQRVWGTPEACAAVASYWGDHFAPDLKDTCKADNVVLACGASEALLTTFLALCNAGDNILLPAPGFGMYAFFCDLFQIEGRLYNLKPEEKWETNLEHVRSLVDDKTRAILLTNPSNPCGSNFSRQHVSDILALADELKVPVIADEIYAGMVYEGEVFTSVAAVESAVPRFVVGGTAKLFMAPGWRLGWVMLVDPQQHAKGIIDGMHNLCMMSLGPNALTQKALPDILSKTTPEYLKENMREIEKNAKIFADALEQCPGLSCQHPQGALYIMVKIDFSLFTCFEDDLAFYQALEDEENVQVIPGTYLFMPGFFRVCITRPAPIIEEVMTRLQAFCERHITTA